MYCVMNLLESNMGLWGMTFEKSLRAFDPGYENSLSRRITLLEESVKQLQNLLHTEGCGNCFEGKSDMDHACKVCGGSGIIRKGENNEQ